MRCSSCGYLSLQSRPTCRRCGAPLEPSADIAPPLPFPEERAAQSGKAVPAPPAKSAEGRRTASKRAGTGRRAAKGKRDLQPRLPEPAKPQDPVEEFAASVDIEAAEAAVGPPAGVVPGLPPDDDVIPPAIVGEAPAGAAPEPIIDRDDEVPERFWAPEPARFGRRLAALLADQLVLAGLLAPFAVAAYTVLRAAGAEPAHLLGWEAIRAAGLPFALLALLVSFGYFVFFHGRSGRTPGKRLAGLAVLAQDGGEPTFATAALRWVGALASLLCLGAGFAWALGPHRQGWAERLSGTVLGTVRRGASGAPRDAGRR